MNTRTTAALPETMQAMVLTEPGQALVARSLSLPVPGPGELLIEVRACGVCRTDLHVVDGELTQPRLPLVPGHEIVGVVAGLGAAAGGWRIGDRVGVPWLARSCGVCRYCRRDQENLCESAHYTGYTRDGGYAEYATADARFCLPLPLGYDDVGAAPLLCAGLIGHRAYRMAGERRARLGLYGFGAAAHIVAQVAVHEGSEVYAFTRPGDAQGQAFARDLGAVWAGGSDETPPEWLDAALIFAPVGALVPAALAAVDRGGSVVCGGIHMSDIPSFSYQLLWQERTLRSVANLTRVDGAALMAMAARTPIHTHTQVYPLADANAALDDLRAGRMTGAAVLVPDRLLS